MLADAHTDAAPEFRGRARLIGIDVDDIKPGDILTTGKDIDVAGAWHCSAPGCGLVDIGRAVVEDHIARLRRPARARGEQHPHGDHIARLRPQAPFGEDVGTEGEH